MKNKWTSISIKHCALQCQWGVMSEQNEEGKGSNIRQKNRVSSGLRNAPLHSKPECMQYSSSRRRQIHTQKHCTPQRVCADRGGAHQEGEQQPQCGWLIFCPICWWSQAWNRTFLQQAMQPRAQRCEPKSALWCKPVSCLPSCYLPVLSNAGASGWE